MATINVSASTSLKMGGDALPLAGGYTGFDPDSVKVISIPKVTYTDNNPAIGKKADFIVLKEYADGAKKLVTTYNLNSTAYIRLANYYTYGTQPQTFNVNASQTVKINFIKALISSTQRAGKVNSNFIILSNSNSVVKAYLPPTSVSATQAIKMAQTNSKFRTFTCSGSNTIVMAQSEIDEKYHANTASHELTIGDATPIILKFKNIVLTQAIEMASGGYGIK